MPTFRHGRGTKLLFNQWDMSEYFKDANAQQAADTAETTAFGSTVKSFVIGMTDGRVGMSGMFSGGVDEVDEEFQAVFGQEAPIVFTYAPEGLVNGRRVWGLQAFETSYQVSGSVTDIVGVTAELQGTGGVKSGISLLDPASVITVTGNQTGVDTGIAGNALGGWAVLHAITNTVATSVVVKVQTATTLGGAYGDLVTFTTLTVGQVGGLWVPIPPGVTINQFARAQYTLVGAGNFTGHVSLMRAAA